MHLLQILAQRGQPRGRRFALRPILAAGLIVVIAFLVDDGLGQPQLFQRRAQVAGQEIPGGVYLPTDRSLSRAIARARERLADHEYHEVLAFLQQVLSRDEDSFLERAGEDHEQLGLKATARRIIGELPPEGHDAYELLHGATARRQLEAAIQAGDREALAKVVRQYFHTAAGYEAALVLAEMEADQGHRLAAAELYRELIEAPRAAARFEPQLSIAAATNLLAAGQPDDAAKMISALRRANPAAQVMLAGKTVSLPTTSEDAVGWLQNLVGKPLTSTLTASNWLTLHGDPSRNSQASGGRPHLRPRWEARVVNEPSIEAFLSSRSEDFIQRGVVAIPGARPIAVGDVIVMRTPENIVAVDWQTGKRVWETRDEEELQSDSAASEPMMGIDREQWAAQGRPLEERVWDDALMTSLSSDGKRVFVVRGLSVAREEEAMPAGLAAALNRNVTESVAATNQLAAYDVATQGKLAWELDGSRPTGKLAGAFFLGAPLAIDNTLYVMAEIGSALYLVALDAATGQVQWQQQLVRLEQGIALDPARRRSGATPSYAGGILVCPTATSTVVAIDVVKRELAWVYSYTREAQSINYWPQQQPQIQLVRANKDWLDSSAVIAEGRVLLTPPDSSEVHCLDLHSGKFQWKRRLNDALFLGSVDRGNVLVVGGASVQALKLSNGAAAWEKETLPLSSGVLPAGQGYLSDGHYFLPLTSGQIADIDIQNGTLNTSAPVGANVALGNLICYRGSVLSQSALVLDKFEQLQALRQRTEAALAKNGNDAAALRELAELKRADDQKSEAVRLLKRAYELGPDDPVTQDMLVETLLEQLAGDYASFQEDVPLVKKLAHSRDQQIELLRLDAAGLDAVGQRMAAWDAYLQLADFTGEQPAYLRITDKYTVRSDRWISGRLAALWAGASADDRNAILEKLIARRPALENPGTGAELRHYLAHLDLLPGANDVRLSLARYLTGHSRPQEAELELLALIASGDQAKQSAAIELMSKLSAKKYAAHSEQSSFRWPYGHVDAELLSSPTPLTPRDRPAPLPNEQRATVFRQLRIEQDFLPQVSPMQWFIEKESTELLGRSLLGDDVCHLGTDQYSALRLNRDSTFVHAARLGHLLYVALGGQLVAIDARQDHQGAELDVLWPSQSQDRFSRDTLRPRRGPIATQARANRRPIYNTSGRKRIAGAAGSALGSLGPVTPRGVVFQDDAELKCVDPLTGVTLWARTDVPIGCELFGDSELVFAADVSSNTTYVVRLIDGERLENRNLPSSDWLLTAGRNLAQLSFGMNQNHTNRSTLITVTDVWSQRTLCQVELPTSAKFSLVEPNSIAAFDPTGRFCLVDAQSGRVSIDETLEAIPDLQAFYAMRAGDELFVFASSQVAPQFRALNQLIDYPIVNGSVYAFDLKSGKSLWPGPALVRNRGISLSQPTEVPFLVFADRQTTQDGAAAGASEIRVLCLDKRTGETVYRNDHVPDSSNNRFRIRAENETHPLVALDIGGAKIHLTMTDRPRPPRPPANDDLEGSRAIVERGMRALGIQIGGAFRSALDQPTPNTPAVPHQGQIRKPGGAEKPAKDRTNDTDDD